MTNAGAGDRAGGGVLVVPALALRRRCARAGARARARAGVEGKICNRRKLVNEPRVAQCVHGRAPRAANERASERGRGSIGVVSQSARTRAKVYCRRPARPHPRSRSLSLALALSHSRWEVEKHAEGAEDDDERRRRLAHVLRRGEER